MLSRSENQGHSIKFDEFHSDCQEVCVKRINATTVVDPSEEEK